MNEDKFATEILAEIKATSKRWFIAFIVVLVLWFSTIGGLIWYISLPVEDTAISQDAEDSGTNQVIGGDFNSGTTDSTQSTQEKS